MTKRREVVKKIRTLFSYRCSAYLRVTALLGFSATRSSSFHRFFTLMFAAGRPAKRKPTQRSGDT